MKTLGIAGSLVALAAGFLVVLPNTATATTTACTWQTSALPVPAGANVFSFSIGGTDHSGGWVGRASMSDGWHVFAWKNGTVTDYGRPLPSGIATVPDENRAGTIVANRIDGTFQQITMAFRIRGGQWEQLAPLSGATRSLAEAINDAGDIIGTNWVPRNGKTGPVVVRWPAGQTAAVEVPGIPFDSRAIDIDEDGTLLVGVRDAITGAYLPNVVRGGVRTALPQLAGNQDLEAVQLSNGRVTGWVYTNSRYTGVVWERDLTPHALPNATQGLLINRDGLVVGRRSGTNVSYGVWRDRTLEFTFDASNDNLDLGAISDDGTFAGTLRYAPTVWRCA